MYHFWKEFDWIKQDRKKLVVTVGESWTWGDSLGKTQHNVFDDKEFRLSNVYGRRLAETLQADFLNIAKPGESNLWIAKHYAMFVNEIDQFDYDEILVVLTMTEVGREFEGDLDHDRDYMSDLTDIVNLKDFLNTLSNYVSKEIQSVKQDKIKLLIGTNFIDSNYTTDLQVLEKSWVDVIANRLQVSVQKPCYVVNSWVFDRFHQLLNFTQNYQRVDFLKDLQQHMEIAIQVADFLMQSNLNYKKASKHPTPEGHQLWADYLYQSLSND